MAELFLYEEKKVEETRSITYGFYINTFYVVNGNTTNFISKSKYTLVEYR